jgi:Helix-turn-helix
MPKTITPLRQRVRDQGLTPQSVASALNIPMIIDRILDGPPSGSTYDRVIAWLDQVERDGSYRPAAALTEAERNAAAVEAAREAVERPQRLRLEAQAKIDAWYAADRERILADRAVATARYIQQSVERIEHGRALQGIREDAGLTLRELGAMLNVDFSMLGRIEKGRPTGSKIAEIDAGYNALTKLAPKARKVASR